MLSYIIKRILYLIPTLIGVTIVTFVVMRMAPGDPLQLQLSSDAALQQGTINRDQFIIMKEQFHLDKPLLLNFEYYRDYTPEARFYSFMLGAGEKQLTEYVSGLITSDGVEKKLLLSLDIDGLKKHIAEKSSSLPNLLVIATRVKVEDLGRYLVPALIDILNSKESEYHYIRGGVYALNLVVHEPFVYTLPSDYREKDVEEVVQTWSLWWEKNKRGEGSHLQPDIDEWEKKDVFQDLLGKSNRELVETFAYENPFIREDDIFLYQRLKEGGEGNVKISSLALRFLYGKPLKTRFKTHYNEEKIREAAENWIDHYKLNTKEYSPGLFGMLYKTIFETQYFNYAKDLVTFNFGRSLVGTREPVTGKIWRAFKVSFPLMLISQLLIYTIAIPLGLVCAVKKDAMPDRFISLGLFILYSVPVVWAGLMLRTYLCTPMFLNIFPFGGLHSSGYEQMGFVGQSLDYLKHITLPVICLSLFTLASIAMYSRTSVLEVLNQDYVRTARAKGLKESVVILKHVFRNALIPILTLFSYFFPALVGGSAIVEIIFGIPGIGQLMLEAISTYDYTTLMALLYITALITLISILITDLIYVFVDPRISFEKVRV